MPSARGVRWPAQTNGLIFALRLNSDISIFVPHAEAASAVRTNFYIEKKVIGPKIKPFPRAGALNCLKVAECGRI